MQYFGRISYSLYLVHVLIVIPVLKIGYSFTGERTAPALAWIVLALAISVAAAHLLYRFVEAPSLRLASKLRSGRQGG